MYILCIKNRLFKWQNMSNIAYMVKYIKNERINEVFKMTTIGVLGWRK